MNQKLAAILSSLSVPLPGTICMRCLDDPTTAQGDLANGLLWVYCSHRRAGAMYQIRRKLWSCYSPIDLSTWIECVIGAASDVEESRRAAMIESSK